MTIRTVRDCLREEYSLLLPDIRKAVEQLETEIRYCLSPLTQQLEKYERIEVTSRVKDCESAIEALRRRLEGSTFDETQPKLYSLTQLKDLTGVRVLAFPRAREHEADELLRKRFPSWIADPIMRTDKSGELLVKKYHGSLRPENKMLAEYQVVPMLVGLFWTVEHAAIYKPNPNLRGVARSLAMRDRTEEVVSALLHFTEEFEALMKESDSSSGQTLIR